MGVLIGSLLILMTGLLILIFGIVVEIVEFIKKTWVSCNKGEKR
jgi:hypothetical protein